MSVVRRIVPAVVVAMLVIGAAVPAQAEDVVDVPSEIGFDPTDDPDAVTDPGVDPLDDPSNWNVYWWATDLPAAALGPVVGSVTVGGTSAVCSMSVGSQTRTAPPWDFTITPGKAGSVAITQCNGVTDTLAFAVQPGLTARGTSFSARKAKRWVISVSSALPAESLDLALQSPRGKRLAGKRVAGTLGSLVVPKKVWSSASGGHLVVTYPDGQSARIPVKVTGLRTSR